MVLKELPNVLQLNKFPKGHQFLYPLDMGGAGFVPLRIYAYSGWIIHFIKNWRTPSEELGKFLCILFAWAIENAGVSFLILEKPDVPLPHHQGQVFPALCKALTTLSATITLDAAFIRSPNRENDVALIDETLKLGWSDKKVKMVNVVREYLGVHFLSKVCRTNGISLQPMIDNCTLHYRFLRG